MDGSRYYVVRSEGTNYGIGFGSALAIAISYTTNKIDPLGDRLRHSGLAVVIYFAPFRS